MLYIKIAYIDIHKYGSALELDNMMVRPMHTLHTTHIISNIHLACTQRNYANNTFFPLPYETMNGLLWICALVYDNDTQY